MHRTTIDSIATVSLGMTNQEQGSHQKKLQGLDLWLLWHFFASVAPNEVCAEDLGIPRPSKSDLSVDCAGAGHRVAFFDDAIHQPLTSVPKAVSQILCKTAATACTERTRGVGDSLYEVCWPFLVKMRSNLQA